MARKPPHSAIATMIRMGAKFQWGRLVAVGNGVSLGERYYFFENERGGIAMIPADIVEGREPLGIKTEKKLREKQAAGETKGGA